MPQPERTTTRITVSASPAERQAWKVAAAQEDVSMSEWLRRAGNARLDGEAAAVAAKRESLKQAIRDETAHVLDRVMRIIDRHGELGLVAGGVGCMGCHGLFSHIVHHLIATPLL